jgi:hypothetical protein
VPRYGKDVIFKHVPEQVGSSCNVSHLYSRCAQFESSQDAKCSEIFIVFAQSLQANVRIIS